MANTWASAIISIILTYSAAIWDTRNGIPHGRTFEEQRAKEVTALSQDITKAYEVYEKDPFIIPRSLSSMFTSRTLQQRLSQDVDSMQCWLRSYNEGILMQQLQTQKKHEAAKKFFLPRKSKRRLSSPPLQPIMVTNSPDTSYSDSIDSIGSYASSITSMLPLSLTITPDTQASSQSSSTAEQSSQHTC